MKDHTKIINFILELLGKYWFMGFKQIDTHSLSLIEHAQTR